MSIQFASQEEIRRALMWNEVKTAFKAALIIGPLTSLITSYLQPAHISLQMNFLAGLTIGTIIPGLYLSLNSLAQERLRHFSPPHFVVVATTLSILLITTFGTMIPLGMLFFPEDVFTPRMISFGVVVSIFFALVVSIISTLTQFTGKAVVRDVYLGRYYKPRVERRIFLFVDIRSSSSLAESVGVEEFFELVHEFHLSLETFARYYGGTIYKYLGDGEIIIWPEDRAKEALMMLMNFAQEFETVQARVKRKFDRELVFTAGLHCGQCTISEIGFERKEIGYWGDAVNTTQRIQEACKTFQSNVLVSEDIVSCLDASTLADVEFERFPGVTLRGKNIRIDLLKPVMR